MSIDRSNVRGLVRAIAYDHKGARLGRVAQVFLDDRSDEPAWVAVDVTRVRGMRLLPLAGAAMKGKHLVVRAERSTVRSAPRIDLGDGQLSSQDESRLLEHYGLVSDRAAPPTNGEQRPASPWPDDTERETAWERPGQWPSAAQDTQASPAAAPAVAPQSAAAPAEQRDTAAPSSIADAPTRQASPTPPQAWPTPPSDPAASGQPTVAIPVQGTAPVPVPEPRSDGNAR